MPLRVRYITTPGLDIHYSIERMADGYFYDFSTENFRPRNQVVTLHTAIPEGTGEFVGYYSTTYLLTPVDRFPDGDYTVYYHDIELGRVTTAAEVLMTNGDDRTLATINLYQMLLNTKAKTLGGAFHGSWLLAFGGVVIDKVTKVMRFFGIIGTPEPGQVTPVAIQEFQLDDAERPSQRRPLT